jgi:hypothetical protein
MCKDVLDPKEKSQAGLGGDGSVRSSASQMLRHPRQMSLDPAIWNTRLTRPPFDPVQQPHRGFHCRDDQITARAA